MTPQRFLLLLLILAGTSVRAQLMDLSFDTTTWFRQDYVDTDFYLEGGSAHFDIRFDASRPTAGDDFVRIRVTDSERGLVFDERRSLDLVGFSPKENGYSFSFEKSDFSNPTYRPFSETLDLTLWLTGGVFIPPQVTIDDYSQLYVYGWSPMIDYETPGHGGFFRFGYAPTNVTLQFVPVPEPTYGLFGVVGLAVAAWVRHRRKLAIIQPTSLGTAQ